MCDFANFDVIYEETYLGEDVGERTKLVNRYFLYITIVSNCHIPDLIPPIVTEHEYYKKRNKNLRSRIVALVSYRRNLSAT